MAAGGSKRWYFSEEKLASSPSRRATITADKEESYRQQAANFIQDMGQRLQVTQLCINTAIVYMQRFYMFHSFSKFHRNSIAAAALFLAAKVEEQPRKLEHVIKVSHICLHRDQPHLDSKSEQYLEQAQELVSNENILLQTLGFDVAIDHPHTHVVKCCQLVKASKELAQTSYFMATNSLHLTTMCLRYPPTIVACVCIHLACKWSKYEIPLSGQGKPWYSYVDPTSNIDQIERLTKEFLTIFDKCPSRLKKKILQSHNDTKEEEDRRARDNTQSNQYRLDFGEGKPGAAPAPGTSVSNSRQGGSSSGSGGQQGKPHQSARPSSQPPTSGHKYPPGHPSASKAPSTSHSKPPGHPSSVPQGQHPSKPSLPPGHHINSKTVVPPPSGYRPGQPKHGEKPGIPPLGHRSNSHSRSQSQGGSVSGPPGPEDQHRAAKERERREASAGREHGRPDHKQPTVGAPGIPPGYRTSATSQPPPYPGQQQPRDKNSSSQLKTSSHPPKAMPRSIFDLSPEKSSRPDKPPPPIAPISEPVPTYPSYRDTLPPYPGQAPPPSYQDPNTVPSYQKPSVTAPCQPPLSLSPIRDTPSLSSLSRQPSLEPGEILDTPTPTHIASMFSYPPKSGYSTKPPHPQPPKPKEDNRSLQSILGFSTVPTGPSKPSEPAAPSKLQQALFDPDFDVDIPASLATVPSIPSIPVSADTDFKPKTETVSDFSELFGDDSNSSNFTPSFSQSRPFSTSFKGGPIKAEAVLPSVKSEPRVKDETSPTLPSLPSSHAKLPSSPLKPPKRERDSSESKRKVSDRPGSGSDEKKPRVSSRSGGLFSPSPERKSSAPLPNLRSPLTSPSGQGKRTRTASTSSNGEAMVNVQKLEHIAPEFQAFKGTHGPASILVGPDGQPSPNKDRTAEEAGIVTTAPHQPWTQQAPAATALVTASNNTTSPAKHVKKEKEGVSPAKSTHKRERGSSGETHSVSQEKKRSSSGHHSRPDKHSSKPAQTKDRTDPTLTLSDPTLQHASLPESPVKQQVATTAEVGGQEVSPAKREEEEKKKHKDKKDDKHKKKKEKKEKKEKKDKKDKKRDEDGKKEDKDRKHKSKKKSKDREKDKEKERSKVSGVSLATPTQPKLKIKMATPTVSPGRAVEQESAGGSGVITPHQPAIPKIKLKLGGTVTMIQPDSNSHSSSSKKDKEEKRKRSSSSVKLDKLEGPAAKMARAIGTDPSKEARFLEESFKKKDDRKIVKPRLLPQTDGK